MEQPRPRGIESGGGGDLGVEVDLQVLEDRGQVLVVGREVEAVLQEPPRLGGGEPGAAGIGGAPAPVGGEDGQLEGVGAGAELRQRVPRGGDEEPAAVGGGGEGVSRAHLDREAGALGDGRLPAQPPQVLRAGGGAQVQRPGEVDPLLGEAVAEDLELGDRRARAGVDVDDDEAHEARPGGAELHLRPRVLGRVGVGTGTGGPLPRHAADVVAHADLGPADLVVADLHRVAAQGVLLELPVVSAEGDDPDLVDQPPVLQIDVSGEAEGARRGVPALREVPVHHLGMVGGLAEGQVHAPYAAQNHAPRHAACIDAAGQTRDHGRQTSREPAVGDPARVHGAFLDHLPTLAVLHRAHRPLRPLLRVRRPAPGLDPLVRRRPGEDRIPGDDRRHDAVPGPGAAIDDGDADVVVAAGDADLMGGHPGPEGVGADADPVEKHLVLVDGGHVQGPRRRRWRNEGGPVVDGVGPSALHQGARVRGRPPREGRGRQGEDARRQTPPAPDESRTAAQVGTRHGGRACCERRGTAGAQKKRQVDHTVHLPPKGLDQGDGSR